MSGVESTSTSATIPTPFQCGGVVCERCGVEGLLRANGMRLLDRESLHPRIGSLVPDSSGPVQVDASSPMPVCQFEIAGRFSQGIVFKHLAFGVAHALIRSVVERR